MSMEMAFHKRRLVFPYIQDMGFVGLASLDICYTAPAFQGER